MRLIRHALRVMGLGTAWENEQSHPNYRNQMLEVLTRIRLAELQIQEATSLEELDVGRATLLAAKAEVQRLIRSAKRDRGLSLRPIAETEAIHRNMRDFMNGRQPDSGYQQHSTGP